MTFVSLLVGLSLPTITGWLLLRNTEGKTPVLTSIERWTMGFILGVTFTMTATFFLHLLTAFPFTRWSFVVVEMTLIFALLALAASRNLLKAPSPHTFLTQGRGTCSSLWREFRTLSPLVQWSTLILGGWALLKFFMLIPFLSDTPIVDDSLDNWNLRGKVYFVERHFTLNLPHADAIGISSYPPIVPLLKTSLATLAGYWEELLVNLPHFLFYLSTILLVALGVRRALSLGWALLATYVLISLPLYLVHGVQTYADTFLAAHILITSLLLFSAASTSKRESALSFLRLVAVSLTLLPFTKSEGLVLYLPILLLSLLLTLRFLFHQGILRGRDLREVLGWSISFLILFLLPWLLWKWSHSLPFGNAKPITDFGISWQEHALQAILVHTFFEGNLLLLPLFFLALLLWQWKKVVFGPLSIIAASILLALLIQIPLYLFTSLSTEAILQTGYGRGLVHLTPLIVFLTTFLLHEGTRSTS